MNGKPKSKLDVGNSQGVLDNVKGITRRLSMKIAKIRNVYPKENTVDLEWLWPIRGGADKVSIGRPYIGFRSGIHFVPEVGSIVIIGYAFNQMVMLSYLMPSDYENLLNAMPDSTGKPSRIRQMDIGEISLNSIQDSEIYLSEQVTIRDKNLNKIVINPEDGSILIDSLEFYVSNEAGDLHMGMVKRSVDGKEKIITDDGKDPITTNGGNALTELKITVNEFADGTLFGDSDNTKIADVTIGTVVNEDGKKVLNQAGNEIVCEIKLASGALVQIDKKGKINFNEGNMLKPTEVVVPPTDGLSQPSDVKFTNTAQQRAAREGDRVVIPITTPTQSQIDHPGLLTKATFNQTQMFQIASMFYTIMGPCFFVPAGVDNRLVGEITQGSNDVFIGSLDKSKEAQENNNNSL
jgi:hypothetical protein